MTTGQGDASPTRQPSGWAARVRWIVVLLALSFLILQGAISAGALLGQAHVGVSKPPTVALPTPNPLVPLSPEVYAQQIVSQMSFNDKVAQMLMMDTDGTQLTIDQQQMIQQQHIGGAILFSSDVSDAQQLTQLTHDMQKGARFPLFTAIDQEGGNYVNRLDKLTNATSPGEPEIGQRDDPVFAENAGEQAAAELTHFGLNFNLAPVVDVQVPGIYSSELYGRLYSTDPNVVAQMADAYLAGLQKSGRVVGTLKHFPGLGATPDNPDRNLPIVDLTKSQLDSFTFVPYRKLLDGTHVQSIMVTHIMLDKIDNQWPATLSTKVITGLLRQDLGYTGLIITDDLRRVVQYGGLPIDLTKACLMSAEAGADVLMGPNSVDEVNSVISAFTDAANTGQLSVDSINASVQRIITLKIRMGLIPLPKTQVTATPQPATPSPKPEATPHALLNRPSEVTG
jgi:beta-N-acetylhexosaminidase